LPGPYSGSAAPNYVAIGKQTVRGTGVAPTFAVPYIDPVSLAHNIKTTEIREPSQAGLVTFTEKVEQIPTGGFTMLVRPSTAGKIQAYQYGVGSDAIGAAVNTVFPHTLTPNFTTQYVTIEQDLADDAIERFVDGVILETIFKVDPSTRAIRCDGNYMMLGPAWQGSPTAEAYEAATPFLISDGTYTIDGAVPANVRSFTLTQTYTVSAPTLNKVTGEYQVKLSFDVKIELVQLMLTASAEYRRVVYGTAASNAPIQTVNNGSVTIDLQQGTIGQSSDREMKFTLPSVDWEDATYTPLNPNGDLVEVTRPGHAVLAIGGAGPIITTLVHNLDGVAYT
jgi:hypothetical protein